MKKNEVEKEEKLSMTRELKFKELQDRIDEEEADKIVQEAINKSKKKLSKQELTSELEQEIDELLEVETKKRPRRRKVEVEPVEEEKEDVKITKVSTEEDLYLTSSFKPLKNRIKVSKVFKTLLKLVFTVGIILAFIYFVIMPLYKMLESSKPKVIFDHTLDFIKEQSFTIIDDNFINIDQDKYSYEMVIDFDSNIKDMELFTQNNFVYNVGVDNKNFIYEEGIFVENEDKVRHGFSYIEKNNTLYSKMTTSDIFLDEGTIDENFDEDVEHRYLATDDYKYFITKFVDAIKGSFDEEDLVASKEELEIDGFTAEVVRNSLELNKDKIMAMDKYMNSVLLKDQRFIEIVAAMTDSTVEEIKEDFKQELNIEDDFVLSINIYTTKGNKFAGFDIEVNGFRNYYFYKYDNKFVAHANLSPDEECTNGRDCVASARVVLDLIGTTKNNETKVDVILNDEDIGSLNIKELSTKGIDLDYNLIVQDIRFQGEFLSSFDSKNKNVEIKFSLEFLEQYFSLDAKVTYDIMDNIGYVDETKVEKYTDKLNDKLIDDLYKETDKLNMTDAYEFYVELYDGISELGDTDTDLEGITA